MMNRRGVPDILHLEIAQGMSRLRLLVHSNYSGPEFHPENGNIKTSSASEKKNIYSVLIQETIVCLPDPGRERTRVCCVFSKVALVCVLTALRSEEAHAWWRSTLKKRNRIESSMLIFSLMTLISKTLFLEAWNWNCFIFISYHIKINLKLCT